MSYQYKEQEILAHYTKRGMLRYKDEAAYYCGSCGKIVNVICPRCQTRTPKDHDSDTTQIFLRTGDVYERFDGYSWLSIQCRKCDYRFKVIAR